MQWNIHFVRTQHFLKQQHFLPPTLLRTRVYASGVRNVNFSKKIFRKFTNLLDDWSLTFSGLRNALLFSGVLCTPCNSIGIFRFKCIVTWCLREYLHSCFQHCVKSVRIRTFFWAVFSCIQSEYRKIRNQKQFHIWTLFTQCNTHRIS